MVQNQELAVSVEFYVVESASRLAGFFYWDESSYSSEKVEMVYSHDSIIIRFTNGEVHHS